MNESKITYLMTPDQRERLLYERRVQELYAETKELLFPSRPRFKESGIPEELFESVSYK